MKKVIYLSFVFFILLMSWDVSKQDMAVAVANRTEIIPDEAIRLRIIANSDSPEDQWIKRKVRDVVVENIDLWVESMGSIDEARLVINDHLPKLEQLVKETVKESGFRYSEGIKVELGKFPFPTKLYGQIVYPAGDYEALLITLGKGEGQNWWCVLFPPLCFVDMSTADAVEMGGNVDGKAISVDNVENVDDLSSEEVEVKFFIFELFMKLLEFLKSII
ncbi:stage II sporulation protein R [Vulcanibacillus modesticaldus]|uniref:Stage II sporulation protein R n=1 Tax=Vulcanibacillus modesticaldus TaxID=337097 RepID=A0A1D2YW26_9BACI|nr:stage II sporulation protein R [Vulcanibacillus modesticaldus]OEF99847.1 stage II sporulation protein R [Vulcanibacillus modesticaldus]